MYRTIKDFITDWESEVAFTIKVFSSVNDEVKSSRLKENVRSLERLAWHITHTLTEMPYRAGLIDSDALDHQPIPERFEEIINAYKMHSNKLIEQVMDKWTDKDLTEKIEIYGEHWERRMMLSILVKHQIHHRGQMTTLMRLEELNVPGTYGPSKEEWEQFGMSPQE